MKCFNYGCDSTEFEQKSDRNPFVKWCVKCGTAARGRYCPHDGQRCRNVCLDEDCYLKPKESLSEKADFEGLFHDWAGLLDAIEQALGEGDIDRARVLVKGRFPMAEKHGLTVEFTGMPASGRKN